MSSKINTNVLTISVDSFINISQMFNALSSYYLSPFYGLSLFLKEYTREKKTLLLLKNSFPILNVTSSLPCSQDY